VSERTIEETREGNNYNSWHVARCVVGS